VGLQVFGCTALLLITGLFLKNLSKWMYQEKGFETGQVAFAEVNLSGETYGPAQSRVAFIDSALQSLRAIPGVQAAGYVSAMPLEGESWIESLHRADQPDREGSLINLRWVSPGYFETTRHRLVAGRFLEERDRNLNSAVLSEGEARSLWPNENPIGATIRTQGRQFTVIGVVADTRSTSLKSPPAKLAYLHYKDRTGAALFFMVRGARTAGELVSSMREAIWKRAPQVTIARVKTLDAQVTASLAPERFQTFVLMTFAISALFLAMLGIYGTLSYSIAGRKQELGVRIALGATRRRIYWHTLGEAGTPVLAGLLAGSIAALWAGRAITRLLYGAENIDAVVMLVVVICLLTASTAAGILPARRAASVDPMESLRSD
jgi:predicted permease